MGGNRIKNKVNNAVKNNLKRANGSLIINDLYFALDYFDGKCPYSLTEINDLNWHLDHIIPVKIGGMTEPWNCIPVCESCNLSKKDEHLLDWWDSSHNKDEEYKLEKIFNYILYQLDHRREYKISVDDVVERLVEEEIDDLEDIYDYKKLDIYSFLYQLWGHLRDNVDYIKGNINEYKDKLDVSYINNNDFERIDVDFFKLNNEIVNYLKLIGVIRHYSYANLLSMKVKSVDTLRNNFNSICNYLKGDKDKLIDMINNNYNLLLMNEHEFSSKLEYIINCIGMSKENVFKHAIFFSYIDKLKKLKEVCDKANYDIFSISDYAIIRNLNEIIKIIQSEEFKQHPDLFTSTTLTKKPKMLFDSIAMAQNYNIDKYITTGFLIKRIDQKYALINYLLENNIPLVVNEKLNSVFSYMPGILKKKYGIDLKVLCEMYPMDTNIVSRRK